MNRVAETRRARQIERATLAHRTGVAESTLSRIENGVTKRPHRIVREAIARELDAPVGFLFPA